LKCVSFILASESVELKRALFKDCRIIERIVEANQLNEQVISKPKGIRKGYMGHLVIISNSIVTTAKSQKVVKEMIRDIEGWDEFVGTILHAQNLLEQKQIGSELDEKQQQELDKQFEDFNDTIDDMIDEEDESSSSEDEDEEDDTRVKKEDKEEEEEDELMPEKDNDSVSD
jgi:hypothetical protein